MTEPIDLEFVTAYELLSPAVIPIVQHLCETDCRAFGDIAEWCETRGDCTFSVVCPTCGTSFIVEEDDLELLQRWTAARGEMHACGVRWGI
jgi:hypothetical protein